jgi:excisionase family DNA binding protein
MSTQFLTVRQTAETLNVSYMMAFRKITDKEIPSIRLGRKILVPAKFIEDLVAQAIAQSAVPAKA